MFSILDGIKVIDLSTIVLGPYATQFLGDFGADVIKVEAPQGDLFRSVGPGHSVNMGAPFLNCNRNKRSIVLDLTKPAGRQLLSKLIESADVFVHNMRSKSAEKLGIDYDSVKKINGKIVYCNACGFGQGGTYADDPAYDDTVQAISGLSYINADTSGAPRYLPTIVCDKVAGLHLAIAVLAGITNQLRTGQSIAIETPMFESMAAFLLVENLAGESFLPALGNMGYARLMSPMRKPFATKDGYISILPYNKNHWKKFLLLIDRADLVDDPRVTDAALRSKSLDMLYGVVADATDRHTSAQWLALMKEADIPCTKVNQLSDLLNDQHLKDVDFFQTIEHPSEGPLRSTRSPFNVTGVGTKQDLPTPNLGSDGVAILREAGFSTDEIEAARQAGGVSFV